MKIGRIMGVILSITLILIVAYFYTNEDIVIWQNNSIGYAYDNNTYTNNLDLVNNTTDVKVIEYINDKNYPVELKSGSVNLNCTGNQDDISIVKKNITLNTKFAKDKDGIKENTIVVDKNSKVYIYLYSSYEGDYPDSEVNCSYSIDIPVV